MRELLRAAIAVVPALLPPPPRPAAAAEPVPPRYEKVAPSRDGIGKRYLGREIAQVMGVGGAPWLERALRAQEERPDLVLGALDIKPGMTVADVGAGSGYYTRRLARRVGSKGVVYAVEVQPAMLAVLQNHLARHHVVNVKTILGTATDPRLPAAALDLAIMVDVYHELEFPYEMLAAIVRALKPGGRLAFVEFRPDDPRVPIKPLHTMTEEQVRREAAVHPLEWVATVRELPMQHVVVFRKRA
jgi:SAM-dependent methyltransferase